MSTHTNDRPGLRRSLLLALGPRAGQVTHRAGELSLAWLECPPPLAILDLAEALPQGAALVAALDGLAAPEQAAAVRAAGLGIVHPDELAAWLCIDLIDQPCCDGAAQVAAVVDQLRRQAWTRLRADVRACALLLADPAGSADLQAWRETLLAAGVERLCVAGPVDRERVRHGEASWLEQAAVALAAMLWVAGPPDLTAGITDTAVAIGAAAWRGDLPGLRQALAERIARRTLARLVSAEEAPALQAGERPWLSPQLDLADIASVVPPPPPAGLWRHRQPGLAVLPHLGERLAVEAERRRVYYRQSVFVHREAWLANRVERGERELAALQAALEAPAAGWPRLAAWARVAQARKSEAVAALALLEDDMEAAGRTCDAAETARERARSELDALATGFPAPGWRGLLHALAAPWRWLGWLWGYVVTLPRAAQRVLDAFARVEAAAGQEANLHLLRQAMLGLAQTAADQASSASVRLALLRAAAEHNAAQPLIPLPWPWTEASAGRLVDALLPPRGPDLHLLCGGPAGQPADGAAVAQRVSAWSTQAVEPLGWSAAQEIVAALDEATLARWLDELAAAALPLWPAGADPAPGDGAAGHLAWRPPRADQVDAGPDVAPLARWCAERRHSPQPCAADVIVFGACAPVSFDDTLIVAAVLEPAAGVS